MGTGGVFFDACILQELKKEGSGRHSEPEPLFSFCPKVLRRVLAAAGALFSLWQTVANHVDFGLYFELFWEPQAQVDSLWGVPESILDGEMGVMQYLLHLAGLAGQPASQETPTWRVRCCSRAPNP